MDTVANVTQTGENSKKNTLSSEIIHIGHTRIAQDSIMAYMWLRAQIKHSANSM